MQQLRDLGATIEVTNTDWNVLQAWVPVAALDQIAAMDAVQEITPPDYGVTKTGSVNSEGDVIHRADLVRAFSGLTGAGVRVGVISDGVDSWTSARSRGDLPNSIEINSNISRSGDEGTALLEIIHDLAPEAQLAFSSAGSSLYFIEAALWLANDAFDGEGADIIVDDLGYNREPYFEDGAVALAVADAVEGGAVFVSAAGNNANKHYEGQFSDDGDGYHDFDSSSATDIALRVEVGTSVVLQWNDQFGSSGNDYDLFVCPPGLKPVKFNLQNDVCEGSTRQQDDDDDPYESVYTQFSDYSLADVYIRKYGGDASRLKLFVTGGAVLERGVLEGGIVGHPAVAGVLAVGAIRASDPGNDDPESFSDRGQSEIYFPNRETRNKPDVMGIDGVSTTGPGGSYNPFFGTSAAAPHVAGIAALVMEAQRLAHPTMTKKAVADAVTQKLRDTAVDLGVQDGNGYNETFGYGRADAFTAVDSLDGFAATFTVNSTGDGADSDTTDGKCDDGTVQGTENCTLRAAIQEANAGNGGVIKFNITGTPTIQPGSALPTIIKTVFIDGYSQAGAIAGTLLIELDGTNAGDDVDGLKLTGKDSYVRGLTLNRFNGNGIVLEGTGGELIEGNRIGTGTAGTTDHGNGKAGVYVNGAPGVVLRDNVISGNDSHGVSLSGSSARETVLENNFIGTNAAGTADLGNTASGVHVSGARDTVILKNIISGNDFHGVSLTGSGTKDTLVAENYIGTNTGGTATVGNGGSGVHIGDSARDNTVEDNLIANNGGDGVTVISNSATGNTIWENSIHSNTGLGIDLADDGITPNDTGDSDSGPNRLQNFPVLNVFAVRGDQAAARFSLDVIGGRRYIVDFYSNDSCDTAGGNGEGKEWLGFTPVRGATSGNLTFNSSTFRRTIGSFSAPTGTLITATATDTVLDETSEFSACKVRVPLPELEISPATIGVTEDSTTSTTYTVALSSLPTAETKVTMSVDDSAVATISPDTLTFTTTDGTTAQEVTVTGVSDADPVNETTTILHLVSIGDHEFPTALLPVKVIDDDAPVLTLTHTNFPSDVSEGLNYDGVIELDEGDTETYTVELAAEPPGDVTISLLRSNSAALTVSPSSITFTKTGEAQDADKWEWRDPQTVTLTPVSDSDASDEICTIRHESTIGGKNYVLAQARILVRDLALPGLKFEQLSVTVDEISVVEGSTASYTVVPNAEPSADLTVVVVSVDEATVTVEPDSITFTVGTGGNWETAQTVTVTGVSDDDEFDDFTDIGHGTLYDEEVYLLGTVSVTVTDGNRAPYFEEGVDTTRAVAENAGQGATVGAPVTALDLNTGDTLTYTLDDQSGKFSINSTTGQITVAANASLDYEVAQDYSMDVTVEDRQTDGLTDKIEVKVLVTGVNEPPVITGEASPTFREDTRITSRVARYSATDPERDSFTWSVEGTDGGAFGIDAGGNLKFNSQPDHETKGEYSITIVATDDGDPAESGELRVSVEVTDVNEAPEIYQGDASHTYDENGAHPVDQYFARDPEGTTSFTWSLSGSDRGDFTITGGQLQFANPPTTSARPTPAATTSTT